MKASCAPSEVSTTIAGLGRRLGVSEQHRPAPALASRPNAPARLADLEAGGVHLPISKGTGTGQRSFTARTTSAASTGAGREEARRSLALASASVTGSSH